MVHNLQAEDRFEQMLANSATAAICASANHLIVSWNTAAERLFGHSAEDVIGKPLSIIIPDDKRASHCAGFDRAVRTSKTHLNGKSVDVFALHADGHQIPIELSLSMWFEAGTPMFGALVRDITDRHNAKQHLEFIAHRDPVTSLPNRYAIQQRIAEEIGTSRCSLLLLDLDDFKHVNDSLGHSVGDQLLAAVARRLTVAVGEAGLVARLGGDEFAIMVAQCANPLEISDITDRIFESLHLPFELAGQSIFVSTSIGIAMAPRDANNVEQLLSNADLALYAAKNEGGSKRTFFTRAMQVGAEQTRLLSNDFRRAITNDEFELWYQPQFSIVDFQISGVEALLRWRHPIYGLLSPPIFIDVLDKSVFAEEVGNWIINTACAAAADWQRAGGTPLRVAVNLFPAQLRTGKLFEIVSSALESHAILASQLELEITENTVLRNNKSDLQELRKLKAMGVGIAFDDFGTGFASLSLLQEYPLTRLKIDRRFISDIEDSAGDKAIVTAVVALAKGLGLAVIAEGVESIGQEAIIKQIGCNEVQGYLYGHALSADEFLERWIVGNNFLPTNTIWTGIDSAAFGG